MVEMPGPNPSSGKSMGMRPAGEMPAIPPPVAEPAGAAPHAWHPMP